MVTSQKSTLEKDIFKINCSRYTAGDFFPFKQDFKSWINNIKWSEKKILQNQEEYQENTQRNVELKELKKQTTRLCLIPHIYI